MFVSSNHPGKHTITRMLLLGFSCQQGMGINAHVVSSRHAPLVRCRCTWRKAVKCSTVGICRGDICILWTSMNFCSVVSSTGSWSLPRAVEIATAWFCNVSNLLETSKDHVFWYGRSRTEKTASLSVGAKPLDVLVAQTPSLNVSMWWQMSNALQTRDDSLRI